MSCLFRHVFLYFAVVALCRATQMPNHNPAMHSNGTAHGSHNATDSTPHSITGMVPGAHDSSHEGTPSMVHHGHESTKTPTGDGHGHGPHGGGGSSSPADHGSGGDHSSGGHTMFFNIDQGISVLFEFWKLDSIGATIGTAIGFAFLAALYEGLKWIRERMIAKSIQKAQKEAQLKETNSNSNGGDVQFRKRGPIPEHETTIRIPIVDHVLQTILHMLQVLVSYFLMLAFMTYNVWIGLAIIVGSGLGYFIFGAFVSSSRSSVARMSEHCH